MNTIMENNNIIYNKNIVEFITVSSEFVAFLEKSRNISRNDFIDKSIKILPLLYLKAILLPDIEPTENDEIEKFIDENNWTFIQNSVAYILADMDEYVEIQDNNIDRSIDFLNISLSELYADIYQDIGNLLGAYKLFDENIITSALYECKNNFQFYWGIRTIVLLENLHKIKFFKNEEI